MEGNMPKPTHICITDCFQKIGDRPALRYYAGKLYSFPPDAKVPHHFEKIKQPKEETEPQKQKGLSMLKEELAQLKAIRDPKPPQIRRIKELRETIKELTVDGDQNDTSDPEIESQRGEEDKNPKE
jgi:hypothetical protein